MRSLTLKRRLKFFFRILILLILLPPLFIAFYFYDNRLFLFEAKLLWKSNPLNKSEFRSGSIQKRSTMAYDIIQSKQFIGKNCLSIRSDLGDSTGDYYISDVNTTYLLTEKASANWILTFICGDNQKIESVIIRKSCCSVSQNILFWTIELF